jgi:hypothetical protein
MANDLAIALVGVGATLLGGGLGSYATWRIEKSRWEREEKVRWKQDRRDAYVGMIEAADTYQRALSHASFAHNRVEVALEQAAKDRQEEGKDIGVDERRQSFIERQIAGASAAGEAAREAVGQFFSAQADVSLFGSQDVSDLATNLALVGEEAMNLWVEGVRPEDDRWVQFGFAWAEARALFLNQARLDLGVELLDE